jgi:sugar phosphate isomerase/epimerase
MYAINRRLFLQRASAAAAGLAVLPAVRAADDKADNPYAPFTLGIQSYTFRDFALEQTLKQISELGLKHVEFTRTHLPTTADKDKVNAVLKLCKEYGVTPLAWGVLPFTKDADANRKIFESGKQLGVKSFSASPTEDSFESLDKLVDEYKIAIAIHPHGPVGPKGKETLDRWYSAEVIMKAVKDHHALIGACLDTGHLIRAAQLGKKLDPAEEVRTMGARNLGMHLKDHDNEKHTDVVFGKGVLDVAAVLKALKDVKFKGMISIEYEANPDNPAPDVVKCLEVVKAAAKKLA